MKHRNATLNVRTGSGSDRVETGHNRFDFSNKARFIITGVVEHLGSDPVATAPGSVGGRSLRDPRHLALTR